MVEGLNALQVKARTQLLLGSVAFPVGAGHEQLSVVECAGILHSQLFEQLQDPYDFATDSVFEMLLAVGADEHDAFAIESVEPPTEVAEDAIGALDVSESG